MYGTVPGISASKYAAGPSSTTPDRVEHGRQPADVSEVHTSHPTAAALQRHDAAPAATVPQTVAFANSVADLFSTELSFNYDERIDKVVVRVKKGNTDEIIRQIPPEHMIKLAANFKNQLRGLILNDQG
jgi:flagellar protein FlaG